jgi:flagellar motor protein MotB
LRVIDVSPELLAFLREEYDRCRDETLEDERETAIDRYNGAPYGDEEDGRSQVVARDTAEVTDYMVISILRTLVSGDDIVEFVHRNADLAHQATQAIKHLFMDEQDGYRILHDWLKAGLLEKNAVAMTYGEPQPKKRTVQEGVSALALAAAEQQGIEIIEAEQVGEHPEEGPVFNVAVLQEQPPKFCDAAIPNEEFYCSPDARTITEAPLKGRRFRKSISDLVEMGMDPEDAEAVASDSGHDNTLSGARDEDRYTDMGTRRGSARLVWWHEEYARFDANGDGVAELLYIRRTADYKIFSIDEMEDDEDHPFEDWCPFPMQHRRIGQSLADKVVDIERIRTVLFRQALDGIYLSNNPVTYVHEDSIGENTIEDLLTVRPGAIRRWKGMVQPQERQGIFDPSAGFAMLEQMNGERESRTGITRLNQGLDADALNKTATGTALMQAQGQQVEEYLARNFANALARLFTKKAKLLKRHGQPITVPIDGEYVEVDPRQWPEDMIARPRVGLGSGRKEQRMAYRRELIAMQAEAVAAGLPICGPKELFNSAKGFVNDAGLGDVTEFFTDPETLPPQEPQPDPAMAKVQAEMQAKQAELQMKHAAQQADLQLKLMDIQGKLALAREDAQARLMLEQQKAFVETQLAQQQQAMEAALERMKIAMQAEGQARDAARKDGEAGARIKNMRKGGSLAK